MIWDFIEGLLNCNDKQIEKPTKAQLLNLKQEQTKDFSKVKQAFQQKMVQNTSNRQKRTELVLAYYEMSNTIYQNTNEQHMQTIRFIMQGNLFALKQLLNTDPSLRNKLEGKYSLVYYAVMSGHQEIVEFLLKAGCAVQIGGQKSTPLHCACYYGHKHLIPLLLSYGAPIAKKNWSKNTPFDEAATPEIKKILKDIQQNRFKQLQQKLFEQKLTKSVINVRHNNQVVLKKILLNNYLDDYSKYDNTFHGTQYEYILSIAKHGLKIPGDWVDGKLITIRLGHIDSRVQFKQISWGKAIFVSPSIFYATNPVYSQQVMIQNKKWLPFLQVKVKKLSYTKHQSTVMDYKFKLNEPENIQYRIGQEQQDEQIFSNEQDNEMNYLNQRPRVIVIAVAFIKKQFLKNRQNYNEVTNLILNSQQEKLFREYGQK